MIRILVVGIALVTAGCCATLKEAINEEARSIGGLTQPTIQLISACQDNNKGNACDTIGANVRAIDDAVRRLQEAAAK
jgi:hypothetical protein